MDILRILLVDDEELIRKALARALRPHHVLLAESYERAQEILSAQPVDMVLSDCHMPGHNGVEVLQLARSLQPGAHRVMLSGHPPPDLDELKRACVIEDFIPKPWQGDLASRLLEIAGRTEE
jgi:response regulator RpfG family c-di-GMP phosphodiesterase